MGITKTDSYTNKQVELSAIFKALGHPGRLAIMEYLIKVDSCICGDIVDELPLSQATVSQHLRELRNAGLIKGNIEGSSICYCVDEKVTTKIEEYFSTMNHKIIKKKSNCC